MSNGTHRRFSSRMDDGQPKYFITYFGDIYHGIVMRHPAHKDRFFIISKNEWQEFERIQNKTLEDYQRLGWEIRDDNVIIDTIPDGCSLGIDSNPIDKTRSGHQEWKRMFVFGAGASAFCAFGDGLDKLRNKTLLRPPTGYEIFDTNYENILSSYEGARSSVSDFEDKGKDIEGCLESEWADVRYYHNPQIVARHTNIQLYLQELFQKISDEVIKNHYRNNLYSSFANKLQRYATKKNERMAFVSFNYDTIFDYFLDHAFRMDLSLMKNYMDYNSKYAMLFKPHGSCNWGWGFREDRLVGMNGSLPKFLYQQQYTPANIYYHLLGDFNEMIHAHSWGNEKAINTKGLGRHTINKNLIEVIPQGTNKKYYPALLLPYRDKDEFIMHYDHYHAMQWFMGDMEELYLIGWKGNEAAFNKMLKTHAHRLKKIVIVNPAEKINQEVSKNLEKSEIDLKKYKIEVVDTFEQFVREEMDKIFVNG